MALKVWLCPPLSGVALLLGAGGAVPREGAKCLQDPCNEHPGIGRDSPFLILSLRRPRTEAFCVSCASVL